MILVVGATGLLGGMITRQLLEQGKAVRILVREKSPSAALAEQGMATAAADLIAAGAQPVYGDLKDATSLARSVSGVETVIATATAIIRGGEDNLENVDLEGVQALIDAAVAAQVDHFIYTSATIADRESPGRLAQIKAICEDDLKASGMNYTILRPGLFVEIWIGAVVGIPLQAGQPVTLVRPGTRPQNFVSMQDVVAYAVTSVDHPAAKNRTLVIAGPHAHSWTEAAQAVGQVIGQALPIRYVAPGEPAPLIDPGMMEMMTGLELAPHTAVDMGEPAATFGIAPTPLVVALQRMFAPQPAG